MLDIPTFAAFAVENVATPSVLFSLGKSNVSGVWGKALHKEWRFHDCCDWPAMQLSCNYPAAAGAEVSKSAKGQLTRDISSDEDDSPLHFLSTLPLNQTTWDITSALSIDKTSWDIE